MVAPSGGAEKNWNMGAILHTIKTTTKKVSKTFLNCTA